MRFNYLVCGVLWTMSSYAQAPVEYDITFNNAAHHEARISVTFQDIATETLQVRMSRSSPGRYAIHEFGKNVYSVWVVDGAGEPLTFSRPDPYQWDIAGHDGTVTVTYTLFADHADGTYSGIDLTHAHLNMPATFMWAKGFEQRPVRITFSPDDPTWKVATQLAPTDDPFVFTAPDLQYFLDSPTEISNFSERLWQVRSGDRDYTIRLVVHHDGTESDVDVLARKTHRIVDAQIEVFGELPDLDYGTYTFIADYLPYVVGDGMEHRNSTILTSSQSLLDADFAQIGTISHEFIHTWNVERIRPADLEPFDFDRANMSFNLWFAEGFTSYYGPLTILRAGESGLEQFAQTIAGAINVVSNSPGRAFDSPIGMSSRAPFSDDATSIDRTNFANTFISYYTYGAAIALALDLSLREEFEGISLDHFMQAMWQRFGKTEIPYETADLERTLADVTGNARFARRFFARYIEQSELPDYENLLAAAGLLLRRANPDRASLGDVSLEFDGKAAVISGSTLIGSPLYDAGLDHGDEIISVGRFRIDDEADWERVLERHDPDDVAPIRFIQRGHERSANITFDSDPTIEVVTLEAAGRDVTAEQRRFRASWLGTED